MSVRFELPTRRDTRRLASAVGHTIVPGDVVVLEGALGAGKTFFVRCAARALGVPTELAVQSPTFALVHEYPAAERVVVHADLYRLASPRDVDDLGLADRRAEGAVLFVEWGLRFVPELGGDALRVVLSVTPHTRRAELSATGPRSAEHLERVVRHPCASVLLARSQGSE